MSKIGKQPIALPDGVSVRLNDAAAEVTGVGGTLTVLIPHGIQVRQEEGIVYVTCAHVTKQTAALWGLTRALLANAVHGVHDGFTVRLILEGIGYRATLDGGALALSLGFSHLVRVPAPPGIKFAVEKNIISVSGIDRQHVGNVAAGIRSLRKPEPYKGKGIRREGEIVRRKAGKKAATAK